MKDFDRKYYVTHWTVRDNEEDSECNTVPIQIMQGAVYF